MADHHEIRAQRDDGSHATFVDSRPLDGARVFLTAAGYDITLDVAIPDGARYVDMPETVRTDTPPEDAQ